MAGAAQVGQRAAPGDVQPGERSVLIALRMDVQSLQRRAAGHVQRRQGASGDFHAHERRAPSQVQGRQAVASAAQVGQRVALGDVQRGERSVLVLIRIEVQSLQRRAAGHVQRREVASGDFDAHERRAPSQVQSDAVGIVGIVHDGEVAQVAEAAEERRRVPGCRQSVQREREVGDGCVDLQLGAVVHEPRDLVVQPRHDQVRHALQYFHAFHAFHAFHVCGCALRSHRRALIRVTTK
jgi:hypothetical protein